MLTTKNIFSVISIYLSLNDEFIHGSKILCLFPINAKSLHLAGMRISEILSENGKHEVTLVTPYHTSPPKNFKHVFLSQVMNAYTDYYEPFDVEQNPYKLIFEYADYGIKFANITITDPAFQNLVKSEQNFDLIILDTFYTEYMMYLGVYYNNTPVILYSSLNMNSLVNGFLGNPLPPSYVPHYLTTYTEKMSFFQILNNFVVGVIDGITKHLIVHPNFDRIIKDNFPGAPDIHQYIYRNALVFVNSDFGVAEAIPQTPGVINIGGFHIKPPSTLPKDLERIMETSPNGVIYFSLGTNLESTKMPQETLRMILRVFSRLNHTILWKFERDDLPSKPENVFIRKWIPQNDILGHNNTKLFITHGGWHSILETVYHRVPCVALSVFADQHKNAERARDMGFAESFKFIEINEETLETALLKVLDDPKYRLNVEKRSKWMREKPVSPANLMKFWVEFMIKHKSSIHLQVRGVKLKWFEYLLFDVIIFIVSSSIIFIAFVLILIKVFRRFLYKIVESKQKTM